MSNPSLEENAMNQSFTPVRVGRYSLPNRLVMAPMTRSRARFDGTPGELAAAVQADIVAMGKVIKAAGIRAD